MPEPQPPLPPLPITPVQRGRRALSAALFAAAASGAVGGGLICTPRGARAQATGGATLVQVHGRRVGATDRLFAAGPVAGVLLACLAPQRLLGWPMRLTDAALALLAPALQAKPLLGRLAGRGSTVGLEALLALAPDLIVDAGSVTATYVSTARRVAQQTGLPYALVDGRLADSAAQLRELGALLGLAARSQALAAYAEEALATTAQGRGAASARPAVYLARAADGLETATAGAINAEIIEAAGGRNVAVAAYAGVARVSIEQVLAWAPDWVLTQDRSFYRRAGADPAWRALAAVREGRLLLAPSLPFGWVDGPPSVNRLLGVQWLAACLHGEPGAAAQARAVDAARRFHALFYGATPSPQQVQGWLDGRD